MREVGGYIEFEHYSKPMLHNNAIKLNCGRNALAYLIESKKIQKILFPIFMCDSCESIFKQYDVTVRRYNIDFNFRPKEIDLDDNEWLYVVNYYGQHSNEYIKSLKKKYDRIIVDNAQSYFQMPVDNVDTIYTCRKFFGVSDGALLYTDQVLKRNILYDESFERMRFLTGRFERTASEFYSEYVANNEIFDNQPIKYMSKLTENLLSSFEYDKIRKKRYENFVYLHKKLESINLLNVNIPDGPFMYPLYIEKGDEVRTLLQKKKIYVPILWPSVYDFCNEENLEYDMARNILPLPVDQRYCEETMSYICEEVFKCIKT